MYAIRSYYVGLGDQHDRHDTMVLAAEFGTLAAVQPRLLQLGPGVVDEAGYGILLPAKCRHPPGVDDIVGGDQEPDLLVDRDDNRVVHFQQVVLALFGRSFYLVTRYA